MLRRLAVPSLCAVLAGGCHDLTGSAAPAEAWKTPAASPASVGPAGQRLEISGFAQSVAVPGTTLTIEGRGFSPERGGNVVTLAGVGATVVEASPGSIVVRVPEGRQLPCTAGSSARVAVSTQGQEAAGTVTLRTLVRRELKPGEAAVLEGAAELVCNQLEEGARYLVAVVSTGTTVESRASFRLTNGAAAAPPRSNSIAWLPRSTVAVREPHLDALSAGLALRLRLGAPGAVPAPRAALAAGTSVVRRVPVLSDGRFGGCGAYTTIRARVVYSGAHAVVLEDVASPRAGQLDSIYTRLGAEYDARMYPVLTTYFGNPAADRVGDPPTELLFSPAVDRYGATGFTWIGDHYPARSCAASNEASVLYLAGPRSATETAWWSTQLPGLTVHEAKHNVSYAERLSRQGALEEPWMEEASAQIATEIWGRSHYGYTQFGDAAPEALGCGLFWQPSCGSAENPLYGIFTLLAQALGAPERHTPLGRVDDADYSLYGSAWLLLRYAADQSGRREEGFFRELTQDGARVGIANLEARSGRSFAALAAGSALASALDDRPDVTVAPEYRHPSWNLPAIYDRILHRPALAVHALEGSFDVSVPEIRAGGAWYGELTGRAESLLSLSAPDGSPAAGELRLAIVRLR